ncbi:MAG: rod shape-determining protein MreD [Candidatus Omnitrophica bacterium]|nr:rod shape-determining protein MreD [Candidatus Omnitrophota bacterium]
MLFYIFALIFIIFETAFFNHLQFFSIRPNLILLQVTIFSFYFNFDKLKVVLFCLFCGFLKDIFSLTPLGTHMLIFMCLGFFLSYISKRFLRYNWIFLIPLFVFATIGQGLIYVLIQNFFFGHELSFFDIPWRILVLEMFYGFAIFFIFFKLIKRCVIDKLS